MSQIHLDVFESTLQKTNMIIKAVDDRFEWDDREKSYLALRAVLHAVRNRLPVEEAVSFAAQFPMLMRGFYFEGWKPSSAPMKMNREEFLEEVDREIDPLTYEQDTEDVIRGVLAVVESYTHPTEVQKIKKLMPKDIQEMLG